MERMERKGGPTLLFTQALFFICWILPFAKLMRDNFGVHLRGWGRHLPDLTHQHTTFVIFATFAYFSLN